MVRIPAEAGRRIHFGIHMATTKKQKTVKELTEKVGKAKAMYLVDYRGLKHKQLEELRRNLKKLEAEFVVTKNRLLKRALGDKVAHLESSLSQTTATLFSYADEVAPLKEMLKFFKTVNLGVAKAGLLGAKAIGESDLVRLSELPGRRELLGRLAAQLNAPIQVLHYALSWNINRLVWGLSAVKEKKG